MCSSDLVASWFCGPAGFEGSNPDYSNCTSLWLDEIQQQIEPSLPISSTEASELLHSLQRNIVDSMDPRKNVTYFGHEIQIIFGVGEGILALIEDTTQLGTIERLTEEAFGVFDRVLAHASPWEELSWVNQRLRSISAAF